MLQKILFPYMFPVFQLVSLRRNVFRTISEGNSYSGQKPVSFPQYGTKFDTSLRSVTPENRIVFDTLQFSFKPKAVKVVKSRTYNNAFRMTLLDSTHLKATYRQFLYLLSSVYYASTNLPINKPLKFLKTT